MVLYNSLEQEFQEFEPVHPEEARLYYCGATVQGRPHIGHVRSALVFDILTRWLRHGHGLKVTSVRNVTDIDDKILANSLASFAEGFDGEHPKEEWWALAYRFEKIFTGAYGALGIEDPTYEPRATGHIPEMHALIRKLIHAGHAYPAGDDSGDVYFDVRSWSRYGELTRQRVEDMQDASDADRRGKRDPRDFALWKGHKDSDPETAAWDSPWGRGRPGWHLECSAMAGKYLGDTFDIHGGGLDLRFPHHENELAQSAAAGRGFANFWLHNGLVTYQGEKMSKSIGNTISPEEMLQMARPLAVRYYLGQAQYRSTLDYQLNSLQMATAAVERIENFLKLARSRGVALPAGDDQLKLVALPGQFVDGMNDDLNVPRALQAVHGTVRSGNTIASAAHVDLAELKRKAKQVHLMAEILGLRQLMDLDGSAGSGADGGEHAALDHLVKDLMERRAAARANKDWAEADRLRDTLAAAGVQVADGADGSRWSLA
ncbi:cysteine--tRNA ligase [Kocuria sp.]|uniref:cysteine--tRNA ligase n=1 Tax=Kocuria sp. TaxID=1871328 RepID=UPI0026DF7082|nr:cysteine--tRNA ligase [Kocuria sp.]MDO5618049.1 cysteine--tRNA ligase [Kocuria sp.]